MYLVKTPRLLQTFFPRYTWRGPAKEKVIYLTFDDGPVPEITPWVMEQLARFRAKATFFCVGDNICKNTDIFDELLKQGHAVGNHTFNHLNGWNSDTNVYLHNVAECAAVTKSSLFRPPYGRLRPSQALSLHNDYKIVMWDVLSGDFDPLLTPEKCLSNVIQNARRGSIIVFHDNVKAAKNLFYTLPRVLEHFTTLGYRFEALPQST